MDINNGPQSALVQAVYSDESVPIATTSARQAHPLWLSISCYHGSNDDIRLVGGNCLNYCLCCGFKIIM